MYTHSLLERLAIKCCFWYVVRTHTCALHGIMEPYLLHFFVTLICKSKLIYTYMHCNIVPYTSSSSVTPTPTG